MNTVDEPITYQKAGIGGKSKSTLAGRVSALRNFSEFLMTKKIKNNDNTGIAILLEDLSAGAISNISLWQEYGKMSFSAMPFIL